MSSQLKRFQIQPLSLISVFVSSSIFDLAKNTILVILSVCAPESYLKLIHLSSSQADSPFIFYCSVMHCSYEEFFPASNDSVMVFDVAHVLLGHVKSHRCYYCISFQTSAKFWLKHMVLCATSCTSFLWTLTFSSVYVCGPKHPFLKYQWVIFTPCGIKALPTFHKLHRSVNFI